jgi:hypothetical protein
MSSTRTAKDDSAFHQSCYASSPEFERGLVANMVAKRCTVLGAKADRELIWFVQHLSHQPGGIAAVATGLLEKFSHRLGTPAMLKSGKQVGQNYTAAEVAEIRWEIPRQSRRNFPLRGETQYLMSEMCDSLDDSRNRLKTEHRQRLREMAACGDYRGYRCETNDAFEMLVTGRKAEIDAEEHEEAKKHPTAYSAKDFYDLCHQAAGCVVVCEDDLSPLGEFLHDLCLKPSRDLTAATPWYFADLVNVLREHHQQWIAEKSKIVVTTLGKKVCDALDYCAASRSLVLLEGNARLGKSFSARGWCDQHPGKARFVEVPPGNDDASFFRALARGLGLGSFLNYKVVEIRARVESVLREGDIVLVMDEAQRLWPQRNLRYGSPGRVVWVMTMANAGVPICLVSTPQFTTAQNAMEKTGWNTDQLTGRIGHYEFLPKELTLADLTAVGRAVLPKASEEILKVLASYARMSARYLAAVDSIAKRAQFIAQRNGRTQCTASDVRTAMQESVIPSDTMLIRTLERARKSAGKGRMATPMLPQNEIEPPAPARETRHAPIRWNWSMTETCFPARNKSF